MTTYDFGGEQPETAGNKQNNLVDRSWIDDTIASLNESSSTVTRLACAFAPAGHEIHPNDLASAEIVDLDDHHISISAVVCDSDQCVTLLVPIDFPNNCGIYNTNTGTGASATDTTISSGNDSGSTTNLLEECIVDNLEELDETAIRRIREQEYQQYNKNEIRNDETVWEELSVAKQDDELPSWWIDTTHVVLPFATPVNNNNQMVDECNNVRKLLNEQEFRNDIVALATRTCQELYPMDDFHCTKAAVTRVGPAGIIVKAKIRILDDDGDDGDDDDNNNNNDNNNTNDDNDILIIDLPVRFSSVVQTPEELRASVLGSVVAV